MNADQNSVIADPLLIKEKPYRCHGQPRDRSRSMLEDEDRLHGSARPQRGVTRA
jgi:hypothetical protein